MASMASSMELIPLWGRPEWKRRPSTCSVHIMAVAVPGRWMDGQRGRGGVVATRHRLYVHYELSN